MKTHTQHIYQIKHLSTVSIHDRIIFHTVAFSLRCGKLTYLSEKVILKTHFTYIFNQNALFVMLSMLTFWGQLDETSDGL